MASDNSELIALNRYRTRSLTVNSLNVDLGIGTGLPYYQYFLRSPVNQIPSLINDTQAVRPTSGEIDCARNKHDPAFAPLVTAIAGKATCEYCVDCPLISRIGITICEAQRFVSLGGVNGTFAGILQAYKK